MTKQSTSSLQLLTRRETLVGCLAAAVSCGLPFNGIARPRDSDSRRSGAPAEVRRRADLYAFRAKEPGKMVVALTWEPDSREHLQCVPEIDTETRLHIEGRTWSSLNPSSAVHDVTRKADVVRVFFGPVISDAAENRVALMVEGPSVQMAGQSIWAEQLGNDGSRHRFGSPFLAALVAEDESLAAAYDASSPATDTQRLTEPVARVIANRARQAGHAGDADLHGRRLAATLLPDTVRFDPRLPSGFTFAARNGRHPADSDSTIVNSILNGFPDGERPARRATLQSSFPYFQLPSASV